MSTKGKVLTPAILLAFALAGCHSNASQNASQAQPEPAQDPATANLANANYTTHRRTESATTAGGPESPAHRQIRGQIRPDTVTSLRAMTTQGTMSRPSRRRRFRITNSRRLRATTMSGRQATGRMRRTTTTGCRARGFLRRTSARCGRRATGAGTAAGITGTAGYWGPHVGFYGGVNYGYGYDGDGYEGGYWQGRDFYYNRAITRVNPAQAHHVYHYRVTRSYNNSPRELQRR